MNVELINPDVLKDLYKNHGEFACTCYNTPVKYAERVGKSCEKSGHMSGSRCEYIKFRIECDRGTCEQAMRHEIGVRYDETDKYAYQDRIEMEIDVNPTNIVENMQSFRYVNKDNFNYSVPKTILNTPGAKELYDQAMANIDMSRKLIKNILIENGISEKKAIEDANFLLPRATTLTLTIAFTPEALIQFMWKRLCVRAQDEIRSLAIEMKKKVEEVNPEFAKELVPHCQYLLWCPEGKMSCGTYPTRDELKEKLKNE